jgi:dTDP-4-dehydrorhamnose 3,5-epimerase
MGATNHSGYLKAGGVIAGARVRPLDVERDARGSFTEIFYDSWDTGIDPSQWSVVRSARGVLRGMHLHRRHDEYFLVISGRASVGLKDLRPGSPTESVSSLYELDGDHPACLSFPRGILHGWYFHQETIHIQAVSETYSAYGGDDNLGCHWSDPALGIPWPEQPKLVAERAASFPPLAVLLAQTARLAAPDEPWYRGA